MKRLATFTVDGRSLGVDVARVREVLRPHELTRVPLAPPQIAGLINIRGEIVTAFDLRQVGIGLLTLMALATLVVAVHQGLLGAPDMQIRGNGSSATALPGKNGPPACQARRCPSARNRKAPFIVPTISTVSPAWGSRN